MEITFFGGAGGVTGSKHLLEAAGKKILFDCGLFQGQSDMRERNRALPFAPESIDYVILSHAHIDHCGMLPLLVKRGFSGKIFMTPATRDVAEYMMTDVANIEVDDAAYRAKHKIGAPDEREPLFTAEDIPEVMKLIESVPYVRASKSWFAINNSIQLKFYDAGHILGSAVSVLNIQEGDSARCIAYSGDVGAPRMPLLFDPEVPHEQVDTLLLESTYGNRVHAPLEEAIEQLALSIKNVYDRGGKILMPAFSLGRTQAIVYILHKLTDAGRIPRLPIFVDSPLASDLTRVYKNHIEDYDEETGHDFNEKDIRPLMFRNLAYVETVEESKHLNNQKGPCIIIAASGMMTAGRVVHHLSHILGDINNALFITGYQAEGTLGRRLLQGARHVELLGQNIPVHAEVLVFNEFSAHGDSQQLIDYIGKWRGIDNLFLVHGEPTQADIFKDTLAGIHPDWKISRPNEGDTVTL